MEHPNTADEIKKIEEIINPPEEAVPSQPEEFIQEDLETPQEDQDESQEETQETRKPHFSEEDFVAQKKKFSKIQRERHRLLAENKKLKEEYDLIRSYVDHSNNASMIHYEDSVKLQLDKAKESKKRAIELNDVDGIVDADAELAQVVAKLENLNHWKAQDAAARYQQSQQPPQQQPSEQNYSPDYDLDEDDVKEKVEKWVSQNPWFDEKSIDYDEEKAHAVRAYADSLDFDLRRKGKDHLILTPSYFNKIDQYASYISDQAPPSYRSPNIATVRRSAPANAPITKKIKLTPDDQDLARRLGISEENYVKFKEQDIRRQKEMGRTY